MLRKNEKEIDTKKSKTNSPFKDQAILKKEITDFANRFKTTVLNQAKRISDYFEMSCFNYIVHFYELKGYTVNVQNLKAGQYRYKCSTSGIQSNFSHFEATISIENKEYSYEIHHNLAAQSSQDKVLFTTPDISVIRKGKVKNTTEYYETKKTFSYVKNKDLMTFCEVKQFNPFPELLFNFVGVLNELKKEYMIDEGINLNPPHIAPSLMISGKPSKQANWIKKSLEERYCINMIFDLFYSGTSTFSKNKLSELRITGKKPKL